MRGPAEALISRLPTGAGLRLFQRIARTRRPICSAEAPNAKPPCGRRAGERALAAAAGGGFAATFEGDHFAVGDEACSQHLLASLGIHRGPERDQVALLGPPLGEMREPPAGESMAGHHHRGLAAQDVLPLAAGQLRRLVAMVRIDLAFGAYPDLGEPHTRDLGRLPVVHVEGHADAADESIAVVRKRALPDQEALHRGIGDAADLSRSDALEEPERPSHGIFVTRTRRALAKRSSACSGSDSVLDQLAQERTKAARVVAAGAGAEEGDRLTGAHPRPQLLDPLLPRFHLPQITRAVLLPGDRRA